MTQSSPARPALNLALIGLWVVTVVVLAVGVWLLLSSNGRQVELYTAQSDDYAAYLAAQGGTTLGGLLIGAGAIGLLISLATQAVVSAGKHRQDALVEAATYGFVSSADSDDFDDFAESVEASERADAAAAAPVAPVAPVAAEAPVAPAAPAADEAPAAAEAPATDEPDAEPTSTKA
jgi:hypothetical protein